MYYITACGYIRNRITVVFFDHIEDWGEIQSEIRDYSIIEHPKKISKIAKVTLNNYEARDVIVYKKEKYSYTIIDEEFEMIDCVS